MDEYVTLKEGESEQDRERSEIQEMRDQYKDRKWKLEEQIRRLKERESLTEAEQARLDRLVRTFNKAEEQLK